MNVVLKSGLLFLAGVTLSFQAAAQTPLVSAGSTWKYHRGTNAPQASWKTATDAALNAEWGSGAGGFGYGDGDDATTLEDMRNRYTTVYIRQSFTIAAPLDPALVLRLTVDFDDAFVAYLDGQEIARSANITGGAVGVEPASAGTASSTHEASISGGPAPTVASLGSPTTLLAPGTHVLALIGLNESTGSSDFSLIANLLLVDPNLCPPNTICRDTNWIAANSPYVVSGKLTVSGGATLTIEPGVTVRFNQGAGMDIDGRLIAEGTPENQIVFTRNTGATTWNQLNFTANSTTSRIAHAEMDYYAVAAIEAADTTLYLDSINWTNSTAAAVDVHNCSVTLLNSYIPGGAGNEPFHFNGMPANGHALIKNCVFGAPRGYNDSIDFTGGNRPGPIAQFIDNVFLAAVDDCFDMDATDAHIEGNIFLNVKQDAQRDSSSNPITTGEGNGISELFVIRNIFFNCEHTLLLKDNGTAVMQNNTIVNLTTNALARTGAGNAIPPGIILFGEPWRGRPYGGGAIYEGNIAHELDPVIQANPFPLFDPANSFFVVSHSLTQGTNWPGAGNISSNPMFVNLSGPMTAANIRSNLALLAGSPAIGTGPNGLDMGAMVPSGASISGVPVSPGTNTSLTLRVAGPGVVAYKWKLDGGAWSSEVPLTNSFLITSNYFIAANELVNLSGLAEGSHTFFAIGKNSAGAWQETNSAAAKTWTVQSQVPLEITSASRTGNVVTLTFTAEAGKSYSVLCRDVLDAAHSWVKLRDVPGQAVTGPYEVTDLNADASATRFYRLVTPTQP